MRKEAVNSPNHYNSGKIEVIDFLEDQKLLPNLWNVVKYVCRASHKGKYAEDLCKARFYLQREIDNHVAEHPEMKSLCEEKQKGGE